MTPYRIHVVPYAKQKGTTRTGARKAIGIARVNIGSIGEGGEDLDFLRLRRGVGAEGFERGDHLVNAIGATGKH